ncbi:LysM peptidoglycan-binding domain-containing protein [Marinobacterium rhizophilum]|uniref:LysM peptidoglycan-binding domain-containing protein n=1 Tax=Marinobacterium rhizophilum TaxID=420402 RepID=A0ABY5HF58_9GAMM|nr:LysM peptidoglycan-binding domain-containing protein [Marinobacterium rhizophilum]UTW10764.1 LysM peptidoglycan-binding domain-containing protein [Marinobacterium rhizophilum]
MKKLLCGLLTCLLLLTVSVANAEVRKDRIQLRENYPTEYVVVKGDTLWDISGRFLQHPWQWPDVWDVNPQIYNPHLIYPGDIIYLSWVNGQPRLSLRSGVGRLTPKARVSPLDDAIPAIPLKDIIAFLSDHLVANEDLVNTAPYVVGGRNDSIIAGAGDRVYARGELKSDERLQAVYRPATEYRDPLTGEFLGYEMLKIADTAIPAQENDIITLDLRKTREEVRLLDRVLPIEESRIQSLFHPSAVPEGTEGLILSVLGGVAKIGQYNAVAVNVGARDSVEAGNVMSIYRTGENVRDPVTGERIALPDERAGLLMLFKVFDKVSYGLVLNASNVMSVGDKVFEP